MIMIVNIYSIIYLRLFKNEIDALAGEQRVEVQKQRVEVQKQIAEVQQFNKQLDDDIYRLEHQLEMTRELNNQLGI